MNREEFWKIIEVGCKSDTPEVILEAELDKIGADELQEFQRNFDELYRSAYRWVLWGAAYIIGGGCSDDGFIDFRYGLISRGKDTFEKALANPESLAEIDAESIENELFGYVAEKVYEGKTGMEMPRAEFVAESDPMGEGWDFDDENENTKRLPNLMEKYW